MDDVEQDMSIEERKAFEEERKMYDSNEARDDDLKERAGTIQAMTDFLSIAGVPIVSVKLEAATFTRKEKGTKTFLENMMDESDSIAGTSDVTAVGIEIPLPTLLEIPDEGLLEIVKSLKESLVEAMEKRDE